jgi:hypothetical protein
MIDRNYVSSLEGSTGNSRKTTCSAHTQLPQQLLSPQGVVFTTVGSLSRRSSLENLDAGRAASRL